MINDWNLVCRLRAPGSPVCIRRHSGCSTYTCTKFLGAHERASSLVYCLLQAPPIPQDFISSRRSTPCARKPDVMTSSRRTRSRTSSRRSRTRSASCVTSSASYLLVRWTEISSLHVLFWFLLWKAAIHAGIFSPEIQLQVKKNQISTPRKKKQSNLTIDHLSLGVYAPGPQVLTYRPQIKRGVRIWIPFRVPSTEQRVKRVRC